MGEPRSTGWTAPRILAAATGSALVVGALAGFGAARITAAPSCDVASVSAEALPAVVTAFAEGPDGSGSGSGAVLRSDGIVVTNHHVIAAAGRVPRSATWWWST